MTIWIWNSLLSKVEKMGFGLKWRKWINFYIFTVRMSILVNGSPPNFFQISRGYRQVDPLSLSRVEQEGCIHGFKVRGQIRRRFSSLPPHIYRQYFYFSWDQFGLTKMLEVYCNWLWDCVSSKNEPTKKWTHSNGEVEKVGIFA